MLRDAYVVVHPPLPDSTIDPRIYGQYLEHVENGDCLYGSVTSADGHELRGDVIAAAADLGVPVVRWPGGCFADVYHWRDGVGPRGRRPVLRNWHWGGLEPNLFGTDEFHTWCEAVGAEPYVNVNLGTGTLVEALRWMDYITGTELTEDVRARHDNGRAEPYPTRLWGIGNETWGSWEAGNSTDEHYARTLANWADFARRYQPEASVLGVGSAEAGDTGWDHTVLSDAGKHLDYLTHHFYGWTTNTTADYLPIVFTPVFFEARLRAAIDLVRDHTDPDRDRAPLRIAVDEWNIRHFVPDDANGFRLVRHSPRTLTDAVFAAGVLNTFLRLAPDVGMANYVFLVNGNGILLAFDDGIVKTPLYHLFAQYTRWMRGTACAVDVHSPTVPTPTPQATEPGHEPTSHGLPQRSDWLDATATLDADDMTLSLVNRHPEQSLTVHLTGVGPLHRAWTLAHPQPGATNDRDHPNRVIPTEQDIAPGITVGPVHRTPSPCSGPRGRGRPRTKPPDHPLRTRSARCVRTTG